MTNIISRIGRVLKNRYLWIAAHAVVLTFATYMVWNLPYDWNDGGSFLQKFHLAKAMVEVEDTVPSDLLIINTCYDRILVPVKDELGMESGTLDITDREKLLKLFAQMKREGNYRYIVCDISFDRELKTSTDSALFDLLASMKRCVVPKVSGVQLPRQLNRIAAMSEYGISMQDNNFLKYQYLQDGGESTALRMARELDGIDYQQKGWLYYSDGSLCANSHILDFEINVRREYREDGEKNILQLGTEVLPALESGMTGMFKDKIVMIGDCFRNDIHSTVVGDASGIMIIYNAYQALRKHQNVISVWFLLSLVLVYFFLSLLVVRRSERLGVWEKIVVYALIGAVIILFLVTGTYVDALVLVAYFAFFKKVCDFIRKYIIKE